MEEVACTGEVHGDASFVRGRDDFLIAYRAAWLHNSLDAGVDQDLQAIGEREERIRSGNSALCALLGSCAISVFGTAGGASSVRYGRLAVRQDLAESRRATFR